MRCPKDLPVKRLLSPNFYNAIHVTSVRPTPLKESRSRTRDLEYLFTQLESITDLDAEQSEAQSIVAEIVKRAHAFCEATNLTAALRPSMLNPSLKEHLPDAMGKLGRYYSASSELVSIARHKEYRLFENIQVEHFQITFPAPPPPPLPLPILLIFSEVRPSLTGKVLFSNPNAFLCH